MAAQDRFMARARRIASTLATELDARGGRGAIDRAIAAHAACQYGVVTLEQLVALGLSASAVRDRVAAGRLFPIHRGVYAVGRADVSLRGRWLAAVLACGEGSLLSNGSAAALHSFLRPSSGAIHVLVPGGSGRARPGLRIHRSDLVDEDDRAVVDGIPCTSIARTLLDLAATVPFLLAPACNQAEIEGKLDHAEVDLLLKRMRGHRGARRLRLALDLREPGGDRAKSSLERRLRALCRRAGLPEPAVNDWMAIPGEEIQCDFVWHRERVVVEVDDWSTHGTKVAFENDRRRDRVLQLHGWRVVRYTRLDLEERPAHVIATLTALLVAAVA
jgi:very-short-patch-repair endonuclease